MNDVSTQTQVAKKFHPEAFAINLARAMETSGQALAAYLKPRESGEVKDKPPSELAEVVAQESPPDVLAGSRERVRNRVPPARS